MAENSRDIPFPTHFRMQFSAQFNGPSFASVLHILGVFSNSIFRQFNAGFCTLSCYLSYFARLRVMFYFNESVVIIIQVLTAFLQLKYQNDQNNSPFATHPRTMMLAVFSSVVYYLAYISLLRFPLHRFAVITHHCCVVFGNASIAFLSSVLLPDFISPLVYAIFASLSASELLHWLYRKLVAEEDDAEFQVQRRRIRLFFNSVFRFVRISSGRWPQILPV